MTRYLTVSHHRRIDTTGKSKRAPPSSKIYIIDNLTLQASLPYSFIATATTSLTADTPFNIAYTLLTSSCIEVPSSSGLNKY